MSVLNDLTTNVPNTSCHLFRVLTFRESDGAWISCFGGDTCPRRTGLTDVAHGSVSVKVKESRVELRCASIAIHVEIVSKAGDSPAADFHPASAAGLLRKRLVDGI